MARMRLMSCAILACAVGMVLSTAPPANAADCGVQASAAKFDISAPIEPIIAQLPIKGDINGIGHISTNNDKVGTGGSEVAASGATSAVLQATGQVFNIGHTAGATLS